MNQRDQVGLLRALWELGKVAVDLRGQRKSWRPPSKQSGRKPAVRPCELTKACEGISGRKEG